MSPTLPARTATLTSFALLLFAASSIGAIAADWPQWRGPNHDGTAPGFKAPATWSPDTLAKKWSIPVGEGHASPIVVGDRVYQFSRDNDRETMRCLALADGKVLWQEAYPAPYEMNPAARGHGKGPKSTPVAAAGRVFALGINGHFSAWDARPGAVLWRKDFARDFKSTAPVFGAAASPIVDGGNVILHVGGDDSGALTAFDAATGKIAWQWKDDGPGYSTPVIATFGGIRQLITQTQKHCVAVSPADGRLLWKLPFTTPYEQNSVTPVVAGDLVIFGGIQKPTFAVKVSGSSAAAVPATAWEVREITLYMSTPVLDGTTLYGMSDKQRGSLFALNATTGEVLWKGEGRLGENASVTDLGAALLVVSTTGELTVHQKSSSPAGLRQLAKYKIADSPVWASPAIAADKILIKDKTHLTLFQVAGVGR